MKLDEIAKLNLEMIEVIESNVDDVTYFEIDFESSVPGIWIPLDSVEDFNSAIKSIVHLALIFGFDWKESGAEQDLDLRIAALEKISQENQLEEIAEKAIQFLDEMAYESDPGWRIFLNPKGLCMESIYTEDYDIWSEDRELKPPAPKISLSAMRQIIEG